MSAGAWTINDVTQLNPIPVWGVSRPASIADVVTALSQVDVPVSVGGGHFSMGGQTASPGSLHLDMRSMNRILQFWPVERRVRVEAGVRWCDLQKFLDPHGLSVKVMQTYANFTVGGSLSVNCHGRYLGLGPVALSVRAIRIVMAGGRVMDLSPQQDAELFYAVLGGYGALGVIVEAELELAENIRVERSSKTMLLSDYLRYFMEKVRSSPDALFHNADIYPPQYTKLRAVTWSRTTRPVTTGTRLQWQRRRHLLEKYFFWAITETPFGRWRRQYLVDPLVFAKRLVHWRNYEAGYDVAELEPVGRSARTYVLQEYFIPVERVEACVRAIADVLQRHQVNMVNISIRHAIADPGTLLAWARGETFALVMYYKQRTRSNARDRVGVWTRELIDVVLACGGTYYLPYQLHATAAQFHRAYPRAQELFALKRRHDPHYQLRNALWDKYYAPTVGKVVVYPERIGAAAGAPLTCANPASSDFHQLLSIPEWHDRVYGFLHNVFRLYPEDRFMLLLKEACSRHDTEETVYRQVQRQLPSIKPLLGDVTMAIPALAKQKAEMLRQTLRLLGERRRIGDYVEIGSTGRYVSALRKRVEISGQIYLVNETPPANNPAEFAERGGLRKIGRYLPLNNYAPLPADVIGDASVDCVTCYIGLHHMTVATLQPFLASISRVLRPGGMFILRDHDAGDPTMARFVGLIHTIFNAGTGASWEQNQAELRYFESVDTWVQRMAEHGLRDLGQRHLQPNDPSLNVLMAFSKE